MCYLIIASPHAPNLGPRLATPAEDAGALFFLAVASTLSLVIATEGCFVSDVEADRVTRLLTGVEKRGLATDVGVAGRERRRDVLVVLIQK